MFSYRASKPVFQFRSAGYVLSQFQKENLAPKCPRKTLNSREVMMSMYIRRRSLCISIQVSFFENTSEKDPAIVAQKAIQAAKNNNTDVILVDAVGQSQENKDSIDSLSSVIDVNQPNLILYAGDVQAGEHSLGLLIELKRKMEECLSSSTFRIVDGMILTNFSGSVEKIGTAASMAFYLGAPVLFVSSGQSLKDLKKFNARSFTETFLS